MNERDEGESLWRDYPDDGLRRLVLDILIDRLPELDFDPEPPPGILDKVIARINASNERGAPREAPEAEDSD
jgi:hypothetical protein